MYVPPGKKLTNLDSIKKTVEKYHLTIIVSGDENIKQIKKKIDTIEVPPVSN
jgi:acetolactate synthase small subunit